MIHAKSITAIFQSRNTKGYSLFFIGLLVLICVFSLGAQSSVLAEDARADDLFRQGVIRFNDSYYSESALLFQRVLELQPNNLLARNWLGRAYYFSGYENAALQEWSTVKELGGGSPELVSFMENLEARRGLSRDLEEDSEWLLVKTNNQSQNTAKGFRRPAGVLSLPDGSSWLAGFGNNTLVQMSAEGRSLRSLSGPMNKLSGPFGMALVRNRFMYVSQMVSNSVTVINLTDLSTSSFGKKGSGPGEFLGPQYIVWDKNNFVYISDIGNRRIAKYDLQGNFILSFGTKTDLFKGLERPVGLAVDKDSILVADASRTQPALYWFDSSGNYLKSFQDPALQDLEGLSEYEEGRFLINTRSRVLAFDPLMETLDVLVQSPVANSRLISSSLDANQNLLVSDFDEETLSYYSKLRGMYSGLAVQIQRVISDKYPLITVECTVMDSQGHPVLGLAKDNFLFTEGRKTVKNLKYLGAGSQENALDMVIIVQADAALRDDRQRQAVMDAVNNIGANLSGKGRIAIISAADQPSLEAALTDSTQTLQVAAAGILPGNTWNIDQALRLGVSTLLRSDKLRHIVVIGNGTLPDSSFNTFSMEENLRLMQNNRIRLSYISTNQENPDDILQYLVRESKGLLQYVYRPQGIRNLIDDLLPLKDGSYRFSFETLFDSDFGRRYLPIEVETKLFQKSGRDEAGYFAPLKL